MLDPKTDGEFLTISAKSAHWRIEIDKLKCWDEETDGEFRIYLRISNNTALQKRRKFGHLGNFGGNFGVLLFFY